MKIGIVTYHRNHNYGAILQAIATRLVFQEMGHDVYYVDYTPQYIKEYYSLFSMKECMSRGLIGSLLYIKEFLLGVSVKKKRIKNFNIFINKYIAPYCKPVTDNFDILLYGSDQIWRKQRKLKDYDPFYFGVNNVNTKLQIAFAASMGVLPSEDKDKNQIKKLLSDFDFISVREVGLFDLLHELVKKKITIMPDPTLLVKNRKIWDAEIPQLNKLSKPYALFYDLQSGAFDYSAVERISKLNGLDVIIISGDSKTRKIGKTCIEAGPQEFIDLIRGASFVFSSSFHGVVFSIIYQKPFYASFLLNAGRAESLLKHLGIKDCLLPPKADIKNLGMINYQAIEHNIHNLQKHSYEFIFEILDKQ